ncbi:hypothetical protein D3C81_1537840 [compost metagenome]
MRAGLDLGHVARNGASVVRTGDQIVARLRSLDATDIGGDFVEHVADLHDVPALFIQYRHMQNRRLLSEIDTTVGIDGHIVRCHDGTVLGGLEFAVFAEGIEVGRPRL